MSFPAVASSSSLHSSRVNGSNAAIGFGENAGRSSRRAIAWNGGSDVIGGATPIGAGRSSSPGRKDRKSTRLNSSHVAISYAVFCLKKKKSTGWPYQQHYEGDQRR